MKSKIYIGTLIIGILINLISLVAYSAKKSTDINVFSKLINLKKIENGNLKYKKVIIYTSKIDSVKQDSIKQDKRHKPADSANTKKPFFGKIFTYGLPPADENEPCEVGVFKTFYVFGIKISGPTPVMKPCEKNEDILSQEVVGCGEEYIPETAKEKKSKKRKKDNEDKIVKTDTETTNETKEKRIRKENDFLDGL